MKTTRWLDVPGHYCLPDDTPIEITLHFRSTGYRDPGQFCGPPERCCPPEGDDERTPEYAEFTVHINALDEITVRVPAKDCTALFDAYQKQIESVELDTED